MKKITLHTATVDNGGTRLEAGASVGVGNGVTQIADDRAKQLVHRNMAKAEPEKAVKKPADSKRAKAKPTSAAGAELPPPEMVPAPSPAQVAEDDSGGL